MTRGRVGSKPETSLLVGKKIRVWFGPEFLSKPPLRGEREDGTPVDFDVAISRDLWDDLFVWDDLFQDRFISDPGWKESFEGRLYARMAARLGRRLKQEVKAAVVVDLWPIRGSGQEWAL